jgi:hypothetical protein
MKFLAPAYWHMEQGNKRRKLDLEGQMEGFASTASAKA